jgi:hypothetical protein
VPAAWRPERATLRWSADDGVTWQLAGSGAPGGSFVWSVPNVECPAARLRLELYDARGLIGCDDSDAPFAIQRDAIAAAAKSAPLPRVHALLQNTPNPFNPSTSIAFDLPVESAVQLRIFDPQGRLVRTLVAEHRPAGRHAVNWDARDASGQRVSSGVYFYRLRAGNFRATRRMVLLR